MRQDQASCSLTVDGTPIGITFSKRGGGSADSEEGKYPPGGMAPERALGGRPTVENVTLTGEYRPEINGSIIRWLESKRGRGRAVVNEMSLDADGNRFGQPKIWRGILKAVNTGDYDSDSADAREVELEISTDGVIA